MNIGINVTALIDAYEMQMKCQLHWYSQFTLISRNSLNDTSFYSILFVQFKNYVHIPRQFFSSSSFHSFFFSSSPSLLSSSFSHSCLDAKWNDGPCQMCPFVSIVLNIEQSFKWKTYSEQYRWMNNGRMKLILCTRSELHVNHVKSIGIKSFLSLRFFFLYFLQSSTTPFIYDAKVLLVISNNGRKLNPT